MKKYISLKAVEAEKVENGYELSLQGRKVLIDAETFKYLFSPCDTEKEMMRRESDLLETMYEDLTQLINSKDFKIRQPHPTARTLIRSQHIFVGESLHLLKKRMFFYTQNEKELRDREKIYSGSVRFRKKSNREKTFMKLSGGKWPSEAVYIISGKIVGERKEISAKWIKTSDNAMQQVGDLCKEYSYSGYKDIEVDVMMQYEEGNFHTMEKVYSYSVKIH